MAATLVAQNLVKTYRGRRVVDTVSMEVESGSIVGLLGPNGAGKTTTFYMIVGFIRPDGGKVFLNGEDITSFPMYLRARNGVAYLPQETSIFRKLTVEENILAILETLPISKSERSTRLRGLLEELNIGHSIIARSVFSGLHQAVEQMRRAMETI
jgi:lipopolysaccharide export system ATP-binding protein